MSNPTELPDLEVCPFCGNEAEMVDNGTGSWRVACLQSKGGCGATGRMTFDGGLTAAREWNRRAQPEGEAPQADAMAVPRELLARCLTSMRHAVTFGDTGKGRPPSQTCMFEIEELAALLSAPATQHAESGAQALDVRDGFERWMSNRGEAVNYAGDGMYEYRSTNRQADAFRAGVEYALAAQSQGAPAAPNEATVEAMKADPLGMPLADVFTAEQYRQGQRDAVAADRARREKGGA